MFVQLSWRPLLKNESISNLKKFFISLLLSTMSNPLTLSILRRSSHRWTDNCCASFNIKVRDRVQVLWNNHFEWCKETHERKTIYLSLDRKKNLGSITSMRYFQIIDRSRLTLRKGCSPLNRLSDVNDLVSPMASMLEKWRLQPSEHSNATEIDGRMIVE